MREIVVPVNVYRHLQAGFAANNARMCAEFERNRIFHPGDAFIDVLRWLWGGIEGGVITGDVPEGTAISGEALAYTLLVDHFASVNGYLADLEPPAAPMTVEEMISGLTVAGLGKYLGPREYQRVCMMIRDDVPEMAGLGDDGRPADEN